jgi:class 3 adenylate cyclase
VEAFTDLTTALEVDRNAGLEPVVLDNIRRMARPAGPAASRVGQGDFEARALVTSGDELGQLARTFNDMTGRLAQAYRDLETKNLELERALAEVRDSRQRLAVLEQVKGELAKFVPESVKRLLEQNPEATELEKRTVEVSVLFLDIAGYTRLSEQLEARKLNQLVQICFSAFLEIIQAHHGDVNETAGDGLMVIFQADRPGGDHALNATRAAFAIRQRVGALNEEYGGVFPPIALHMGINTGQALVGATKLGGAGGQRWTFTATGPTTNVAARLAGSAGAGEIVVGPATAERIRTHFVLEALGERALKNVSQPLAVFRVIPPGVYEKVL